MIKDGLKIGRITSLAALQSNSKAFQFGSLGWGKKKDKEIMGVLTQGDTSYYRQQFPRYQTNAQYYSSRPYYPTSPSYQSHSPNMSYPFYNMQQTYRSPRPPQNSQSNTPRPNLERKPPRVFTPRTKSLTQLFERMKAAGILHPTEAKPMNTSANWKNEVTILTMPKLPSMTKGIIRPIVALL
ncbi:hypothetical protein HAX54_007627 [Datura stramonium]|uniref:Uncharacterized protein n=1 Tax=Datura stramonium TaxID=4076 RepID=A0ABS8TC29_DATST|nr:hypothetical protein [Datura stramonium]